MVKTLRINFYQIMKTVYIIRDRVGRKQSLGTLLIKNETGKVVFHSHLLELGWLNNQSRVSCVPAGKYILKFEFSPKFNRKLWEAYGISGRSECKFHQANFANELEGCFAPGEARFDLNRDGQKDMVNSKDTLEEFHDAMGNSTEGRLVIINDQL